MAAYRRILVSARGIPIDVFWQSGPRPKGSGCQIRASPLIADAGNQAGAGVVARFHAIATKAEEGAIHASRREFDMNHTPPHLAHLQHAPEHADEAVTRVNHRFFNRELSWLAFNARVLDEARNRTYPLLERLRFLSISGNNLDEFLMVRVAGLAAQVRRKIEEISIDGHTPAQQLAAIREEVVRLEGVQQEIWTELRAELSAQHIHLLDERAVRARAATLARPSWIDPDPLAQGLFPRTDPAGDHAPGHRPGASLPFRGQWRHGPDGQPDARGRRRAGHGDGADPQPLAAFRARAGADACYISIEDMIWRHIDLLFPKFEAQGHGVFRVLRDSDIEIEEDAEDLVRHFRTAIKRRRRGSVIMLQLQGNSIPRPSRFCATS
jgi:polyphosphate kinase